MPISPSVVRATTISASPDQRRRSAETSSTCIDATRMTSSLTVGTRTGYRRHHASPNRRNVSRVEASEVLARIAAARPRVAAELERPHAEEALLSGVVLDLAREGALDALAPAVGARGTFERCLLWGTDPATGTEDLGLAAALHAVAP